MYIARAYRCPSICTAKVIVSYCYWNIIRITNGDQQLVVDRCRRCPIQMPLQLAATIIAMNYSSLNRLVSTCLSLTTLSTWRCSRPYQEELFRNQCRLYREIFCLFEKGFRTTESKQSLLIFGQWPIVADNWLCLIVFFYFMSSFERVCQQVICFGSKFRRFIYTTTR